MAIHKISNWNRTEVHKKPSHSEPLSKLGWAEINDFWVEIVTPKSCKASFLATDSSEYIITEYCIPSRGTCYGLRRRNIQTRNMTQKALHSSCNSSQRVTPAYNIQDFDRTGTDRSSYARGASLIVSIMRIKQQWKLDQDLPKLSNRREADDSQLQLFVDIWNRRRRRSDYQHILVRPLQHLRGWVLVRAPIWNSLRWSAYFMHERKTSPAYLIKTKGTAKPVYLPAWRFGKNGVNKIAWLPRRLELWSLHFHLWDQMMGPEKGQARLSKAWRQARPIKPIPKFVSNQYPKLTSSIRVTQTTHRTNK